MVEQKHSGLISAISELTLEDQKKSSGHQRIIVVCYKKLKLAPCHARTAADAPWMVRELSPAILIALLAPVPAKNSGTGARRMIEPPPAVCHYAVAAGINLRRFGGREDFAPFRDKMCDHIDLIVTLERQTPRS